MIGRIFLPRSAGAGTLYRYPRQPMVVLRSTIIAAALLALALPVPQTAAKGKKKSAARASTHVVKSGQTLWVIARAHGCSVDDLVRANQIDTDAIIYPGQELTIPKCSGPRSKPGAAAISRLTHTVVAGDTLSDIAKQYDCSIDDIKRRNRLSNNLIHPGQKLRVVPGRGGRGRPIIGQSIGLPHRGRLAHATLLPHGKGYYRRRTYRAYGASHVVFHIQQAVNEVRAKFPKVHTLAIGDLSAEHGGKISQHKSHQSGRDVDIGFYFNRKPKDYPESFVVATAKNLAFAPTFALLQAFADTNDEPGGVIRIFLDYDVQGLIYNWAKKHKVSKRTLSSLFQYPHGRNARHGLIRHEHGHDDHIHVRFDCPPHDKKCN